MEKKTLEIAFDIVSNYAQQNSMQLEAELLLEDMLDMGVEEKEINETMTWLESCLANNQGAFSHQVSMIYLILYQQVIGLSSHDFDRIVKACRLLENEPASLYQLRLAIESVNQNYHNEKKVAKNFMNNTDLKH